jgi:hypothetical protein
MAPDFRQLVDGRTGRTALLFVLVTLLMGELHEQAHILPGAALCGGFGERDFNSWGLKEGCSTWVPTLLGPVFTFAVAAVTALWLRRASPRALASGLVPALVLLFGSNLSARLVTALLGGGDEALVWRALLPAAQAGWATPLAILTTVAASAWPLAVAWRVMAGTRRLAWWLALYLLPTVVAIAVVLLVLNTLLARGVLAEPVVAGAAPLIHLYLLALLVAVPLAWRWQAAGR